MISFNDTIPVDELGRRLPIPLERDHLIVSGLNTDFEVELRPGTSGADTLASGSGSAHWQDDVTMVGSDEQLWYADDLEDEAAVESLLFESVDAMSDTEEDCED